MRQAIWKYQLYPGQTDIFMPTGAKVLCVKTQRNDVEIFLWALVEPEASQEMRRFYSIGTGHQIDDIARFTYIGTVKLHDDNIIAHIFEEPHARTK